MLRLSHSQVSQYLRCAKQYEINRIMGFSVPPGWAVVKGDALDEAVSQDLKSKMDDGKGIPESRYFEIMTTVAETRGPECDHDPDVAEAGGIAKVVDAFRHEIPKVAKVIKPWVDARDPAAVQEEVQADIGGYPVLGYIDLREKNEEITDVKFWTKKKKPQAAEDSTQLRIYGIAKKRLGRPVGDRHLLGVYPTASRYEREDFIQKPSEEADKRMEETVSQVGKAIEAGIFPPVNLDSQLSWVCSEKYCGFWNSVCPYGRKARRLV
jgi:hypothetical protein